jgi:hypothetical protein
LTFSTKLKRTLKKPQKSTRKTRARRPKWLVIWEKSWMSKINI